MRAIAVLIAALACAQQPQAWVLGKPVNAQRPGFPAPEEPWKVVAAEIQLTLLEDYSRTQGLEPTPEEIAAVRARMNSVRQTVLDSGERLRRDLLRAGLDPKAVDRQVGKFRAEETAREERFVLTLIRYWKVGRDLYRRYGGGRIRLSAFGFQKPVDAMERFLIEQERLGRFSFASLEFRAKVWSVFQDKSGGDGMVSGASADSVYRIPPWGLPQK